MKKAVLSILVILSSSMAMAEGNTVGACLDKVGEAAIKQILAGAKGDSTYAMLSASLTNHLKGVVNPEDFRQDIVIRFETSDESGSAVKSFKARVNSKCEFNLAEQK